LWAFYFQRGELQTGRELPFANKDELEKQLPVLKKEFLYAEDFAKARFTDIFPQSELDKADKLTANYFSNAILINRGNLHFDVVAMPWEAQLSPFRDAVVVDANRDSLPDVLLVGNYYDNNIQMGRYDADYATLLINKGNGAFTWKARMAFRSKGRSGILKINLAGKEGFILARNDDRALLSGFRSVIFSLFFTSKNHGGSRKTVFIKPALPRKFSFQICV
jgi:hypothetical protein